MTGNKWSSEAIHEDEIKSGVLNIVEAPVGCGKTTWALNVLAERVSNKNKMVYLIDTVNGKEQLLKHPNTQMYDRDWKETVRKGMVYFDDPKVVVMTYAKFGVLAEQYPDFGTQFEIILCDEIHNLPRFSSFTQSCPSDKPYHKIAKERIEKIIRYHRNVTVIGLSATPRRAEKMDCQLNYVSVDDDVRRLETKEIIPYSNLLPLLDPLQKGEIGLMYIGHITKMKEVAQAAKEKGFAPIAIWSVNSDDKMNAEQETARKYILSNAALPPEYDLVIINASSETSISIKSKVDYIVIHNRDEDIQTQVRGRFRGDLDRLYILDYTAVNVPESFLERKLFSEDKNELCEVLSLRDKNGRVVKWNTVKTSLIKAGFSITEGRENSKRYAIISY